MKYTLIDANQFPVAEAIGNWFIIHPTKKLQEDDVKPPIYRRLIFFWL